MYDREKNLFASYAGKRISRRDLLDGAAKLGIAGAAANAAFASTMSKALAADFNWKAQSGKTVKLLLNKHPYVD
ncbi:MAG: ABC transporter substrate-binding protein, partial [Bradyrhizobium sp.]|nr:ABC transporter substrate-binding protein [Bradyrhizobium sp.]